MYQGNELFELRLVDPDNRGHVDYLRRQTRLCELMSIPCRDRGNQVRKMSSTIVDGVDYEGNTKLFLIWQILIARHQYLALFQDGAYLPLTVQGPLSKHLIAFARKNDDSEAIVVAPRLCAQLLANQESVLSESLWKDTYIEVPETLSQNQYQNCFSSAPCLVTNQESGSRIIRASDLFKDFPWTLLTAAGTNTASPLS